MPKPDQPADPNPPQIDQSGPRAQFQPAPLPTAQLSHRERIACLRLARSETVGPATFRALINRFGGAENALSALPELARRGGRRLAPRVPAMAQAEAELAAADAIGATPVFTIEPGYPPGLAALDMPPPMIYARGHLALATRPAVAIVGSRDASPNGVTLAHNLAADLGRAGLVVTSGLARGIDGAAHEAALASGTIAVVAGGLDVIYPPEHAQLHAAIAAGGCIITEHPAGFRPRGRDFPRRNRLISGLSLGVVIVEAAARSGSLTTARFAGEQGREVCAVPGHPLDPRAAGTNALIRNGATLVRDGDDVLESLRASLGTDGAFRDLAVPYDAGLCPSAQAPADIDHATPDHDPGDPRTTALPGRQTLDTDANLDTSTAARDRVLRALSPSPSHVDSIAKAAEVSPRELQIILLELSLAGRISHLGAQLVALNITRS